MTFLFTVSKRKRLFLCIVFSLALTPLSALADEWVLRMDGIGPLKIGMSFDDANRASGSTLKRTPPNLRGSVSCDFIPVRRHPGLALMFIDERLARVDVFGHANRTLHGIRVGDAVQSVFSAYPNLEVEPHAYEENEKYLTTTSGDGALALRFETRDGKISQFYAGEEKPVHYIENCL